METTRDITDAIPVQITSADNLSLKYMDLADSGAPDGIVADLIAAGVRLDEADRIGTQIYIPLRALSEMYADVAQSLRSLDRVIAAAVDLKRNAKRQPDSAFVID